MKHSLCLPRYAPQVDPETRAILASAGYEPSPGLAASGYLAFTTSALTTGAVTVPAATPVMAMPEGSDPKDPNPTLKPETLVVACQEGRCRFWCDKQQDCRLVAGAPGVALAAARQLLTKAHDNYDDNMAESQGDDES